MNPADYSEISFPWLNIQINPPRSLEIGPLSIHLYGLIIAVGLLLAVIYGCRRGKRFGIKEDDILDGVLWIVPFAILCARLYYCAFSWESGGYAANPISILYIWQGGLAIYGGVLGAAVGVIILCLVKKIRIGALLDLVSLGFLIGQSIGRWGNFFNREAFGAATDSFFRMGLFHSWKETWEYYHPTFLYESLWNALGFVALHFLSKKRKYDGQIALGYVAWYGLGRTLIEGLRVDSLYWGSIRVSQMLAAISCLAAVIVLMIQAFRTHDSANLFVNRRAALEAENAAEQPEAEPEQQIKAELAQQPEAEPAEQGEN